MEPLVAQRQLDGTWLVSGTFPNPGLELGGVPHALIREKDGEIIRIWHDK